MLYVDLSETAWLIAAMTWLSVAAPFASSTRRLTIFAPGAIPLNVLENGIPVEIWPSPAISPAMCVPWPYWSPAVEVPDRKDWLYTTREIGRGPVYKSG